MKKTISTEKAPSAIGPYSQGVCTGNLVFTSGQLPINPASGKLISGCIKEATGQALQNVAAILQQAGLGLQDVVKVTVLMKDLNSFAQMNEVYATFFGDTPPARSCFQVARLPMDALIEIEAIAAKKVED